MSTVRTSDFASAVFGAPDDTGTGPPDEVAAHALRAKQESTLTNACTFMGRISTENKTILVSAKLTPGSDPLGAPAKGDAPAQRSYQGFRRCRATSRNFGRDASSCRYAFATWASSEEATCAALRYCSGDRGVDDSLRLRTCAAGGPDRVVAAISDALVSPGSTNEWGERTPLNRA